MGEPLQPAELRAMRKKARATALDALQVLGGEAARADVLARALKIGRWTQRELAAPGTGRHARRVDHELSWALTDLKKAGLLVNPARGVWALADHLRPQPATPVPAPVELAESVPPPFVATVSQGPPPSRRPAPRPSLLRRLLA
jgi:restriction endonuclease Mrr